MQMSHLHNPFRYDYVGSFLRPENLKQARRDFDEGKIDYAKLKEVEEQAITDLITKVKSLGYHVITDGEFRRATWHLDFMWGLDGVGHVKTKTGLPFHGEAAMIDDTYLVGKIGLSKEHPFVEHFRFVKQFEDENTVAKQTIPAPAQVLAQFTMPFNREATEQFYESDDKLIDDLVTAYKKVIDDLYAAVISTRLMQAAALMMRWQMHYLQRRMQPVIIWSSTMRDPVDLLRLRK